MQHLCHDGEIFSCVKERVRRFGEHCMRTSMALHFDIGRKESVIELDMMMYAIAIERARLMEYREEFGYLGVPQVERDAQEVVRKMESLLTAGQLPMTEAKIRAYTTTAGGLRFDESRFREAFKALRNRGVVVLGHMKWGDRTDKWTLSHEYLKQPFWARQQMFAFPEK